MTESGRVPEIEPDAAFKDFSSGRAVILDVREADELQQVSVDGALHIPLGELQDRISEVPLDREVYVLCHVGQRSAMATQFLRQLGHERAWNIRGGIINWVRGGMPVSWPTRN
jgi:rhodanese-related sulfurtransferase